MDISVIRFCNNTRKKLFCIQFWYIFDVEHDCKQKNFGEKILSFDLLLKKFCPQTLINLAWEEMIILISNIFLQDNT